MSASWVSPIPCPKCQTLMSCDGRRRRCLLCGHEQTVSYNDGHTADREKAKMLRSKTANLAGGAA